MVSGSGLIENDAVRPDTAMAITELSCQGCQRYSFTACFPGISDEKVIPQAVQFCEIHNASPDGALPREPGRSGTKFVLEQIDGIDAGWIDAVEESKVEADKVAQVGYRKRSREP